MKFDVIAVRWARLDWGAHDLVVAYPSLRGLGMREIPLEAIMTSRVTPKALRDAVSDALRSLGFGPHRLSYRGEFGGPGGLPGFIVRAPAYPPGLPGPLQVHITLLVQL
jgi:hypothetical protein